MIGSKTVNMLDTGSVVFTPSPHVEEFDAMVVIFGLYRDVASDVGDNLCNVENDVKRRFLYSGVFHYVNTHMYFISKGYSDNYQIMKLFCNTN